MAWTQDDDDRLRTLFASGYLDVEIARRMGRTVDAIKRRRLRIGVLHMPPRTLEQCIPRRPDEVDWCDVDEAARHIRHGRGADIARLMYCTPATAEMLIEAAGYRYGVTMHGEAG